MLRMRKNEKGAPFGKRGQPSPGNGGTVDQRTRGEPKDLTTRAKGKRGGGSPLRGVEGKCSRGPNGNDYGSAPAPHTPGHRRAASTVPTSWGVAQTIGK